MKITFKRWESSAPGRTSTVQAVTTYGDSLNVQSGPVEWDSPNSAMGKVDALKLEGDYLLKFEFQKYELRSWLKQLIETDPEYSSQLLAEAHAALLIAGIDKKTK